MKTIHVSSNSNLCEPYTANVFRAIHKHSALSLSSRYLNLINNFCHSLSSEFVALLSINLFIPGMAHTYHETAMNKIMNQRWTRGPSESNCMISSSININCVFVCVVCAQYLISLLYTRWCFRVSLRLLRIASGEGRRDGGRGKWAGKTKLCMSAWK